MKAAAAKAVTNAAAEQAKQARQAQQQVATQGNGGGAMMEVDPNDVFNQYGESASSRPLGTFLKFSKGDWLYGMDGKELPRGTKMVANMLQFRIGWQRWWDNKPTDQESGLLISGYKPPRRSELGDHDQNEWEVDETTGKPRDPWQFFNAVPMTDVKGEELYIFSTSSRGGIGALGELCKIYARFRRLNPTKLPIVALGVDSYMHSNRAFGRIKVPQFQLAGWADVTLFQKAEAAALAAASEENGDDGDEGDEGDDALM